MTAATAPTVVCCCGQAALSLLGLDGDSWVRIEAAEQQQHQHGQQQGALKRHKAVCEAPVRAVLQVRAVRKPMP